MDVVADIVLVAADGTLNIQPSSGEKWIIMVITHEYDVELYTRMAQTQSKSIPLLATALGLI